MTLQDLGNLGELIGGLGVIASLLYLATQIRQSSRVERLKANQAVSESMSAITEKMSSDPELFRIFKKVRDTQETLSDDETERLGMFLYQFFGKLAIAQRFAEIDPGIGQRYLPIRDRFLRIPAVQAWWSRQREFHPEAFRSIIDARLREIANEAPPELD